MAKLFSDAECASIFRAVTGHSPCGPSDLNGVAPVVVTPAVPGPGVRIRKKSNLDLTGRLVKRGLLVSWGGLRFKVLRIEGGRAYYGDSFSNSVACGLVQVVA